MTENILISGKIPPQAIDMEDAVLCAFLIDKETHEYIESLKPEHFYMNCNILIFQSIQEMYNSHKNIDLLTLSELLKNKKQIDEVGGVVYLTYLSTKLGTAGNVNEYISIIIEKYVQREIIRNSSEFIQAVYNEKEIDTVIDEIDKFNDSLNANFIGNSEVIKFGEILIQNYHDAESRYENNKQNIKSGIPIPVADLQKVLGGWQKSDLIIIAARPSVGKTAFALHCAKFTAKNGFKTGFFSLEMSKEAITDRMGLSETNINPEKWRNGEITENDFAEFEKVIAKLKEIPLLINDKSALKPSQINAFVRKHKFDIIFIDYLQLMTANVGQKYQNRNNEVGEITHRLKQIAKDYNIPVILLCQLNRSLEGRASKIPGLADLRDSGEIEQDADIVLFPVRPAMYEDVGANKAVINYHIAKHRNGRVCMGTGFHNEYINDFFDQQRSNYFDLPY